MSRRSRQASVCALALLAGGMFAVGCGAQEADEPAAETAAAETADDHAEDAAHVDTHGGDPNPLAVDLDLAIWTGVVFVVLMLVLGKFAWPAICEALDQREQRIADHMAAAEAKHEESKRLLAQHEAKLASAADEVRELLEEARRDAEHTKSQIIAEAKKAAQEESQRAVREVEQAKDAALHELAQKSADAAIELATNVVRQQINPERQAEIIREALGKLAVNTASHN
jgi:F-type H+-transporting ATPase subunit b